MEEAYAAAKSAVLRLVSSKGEEAKYQDSGEVLRSVLQRRPVALGFVVSLTARKLQGESMVSSFYKHNLTGLSNIAHSCASAASSPTYVAPYTLVYILNNSFINTKATYTVDTYTYEGLDERYSWPLDHLSHLAAYCSSCSISRIHASRRLAYCFLPFSVFSPLTRDFPRTIRNGVRGGY